MSNNLFFFLLQKQLISSVYIWKIDTLLNDNFTNGNTDGIFICKFFLRLHDVYGFPYGKSDSPYGKSISCKELLRLQLSESLDLFELIRDNYASLDDNQFLLKFEKILKRYKGFESLILFAI